MYICVCICSFKKTPIYAIAAMSSPSDESPEQAIVDGTNRKGMSASTCHAEENADTNDTRIVLPEKPGIQVPIKVIKRYSAWITALAGFEIQEMKKMNEKLDLCPRMETKVKRHAESFPYYEPGVEKVSVLDSLKVKRKKELSEMILSGSHLWKRFREIKRVVVNELTPAFLKTLTPDRKIPSGKTLTQCLSEARTICFQRRATKKGPTRQDAQFDNDAEVERNGEDDWEAGDMLDIEGEGGESLNESPEVDQETKNQEHEMPQHENHTILKRKADAIIASGKPPISVKESVSRIPDTWYPSEWLVFVNMGLPAAFVKGKTVAPDFKLQKSEGFDGCGQDLHRAGKEMQANLHLRNEPDLGRKKQRIEEKKEHSWIGKLIALTRNERHEHLQLSLDQKLKIKEMEIAIKGKDAEIQGLRAEWDMAKVMNDEDGMKQVYLRLKCANADLTDILRKSRNQKAPPEVTRTSYEETFERYGSGSVSGSKNSRESSLPLNLVPAAEITPLGKFNRLETADTDANESVIDVDLQSESLQTCIETESHSNFKLSAKSSSDIV